MAGISEGLWAARSGIQSHGAAISVLADNIANANTTGFKSSRAEFVDLLAGNLSGSGNNTAVGSGSEVHNIRPVFNQGSLEFTDRGLDVGIEGNGLFVVQDVNGSGQRFYTRAGNFSVGSDGNIINQNGYAVMGFATSGTGGLGALNINDASQSSVATTAVSLGGNLNAESDRLSSGVTPATAFTTYAQLNDNSEYSTSYNVFDTLGVSHSVTTYFFHMPDSSGSGGNWQALTYADGADISGGTAGSPSLIGSAASIAFTTSGARSTAIPAAGDISATVTWSNNATGPIGITVDPITQFGTDSTIDTITQDGTGAGSIIGFTIEKDGSLFANLSNGQSTTVGTVALANFENVEALHRAGNSLFTESIESGEAVVGNPGTGRFGSLQGGALEQSTTDIADDFIKLISFQRAFQGSSRIISSIDNLLNDIVNIA